MSNPTKGPYKVEGTCIYALEFDSWRKGEEQFRNRIYANVQGYKDTPKEEVEATARLMASAPELLESLKACAAMIRQECADGEYHDTYLSAIAVITKALGHHPKEGGE